MKKNLIIVLLSVVSLVSMMFAIYEKTVATRLQVEAEAAMTEAIKQKQEAIKQRELALISEVEAMKQHAIAVEQSALVTKAMKTKH